MKNFKNSSLVINASVLVIATFPLFACGSSQGNPIAISNPTQQPLVKIEDAFRLPDTPASSMPKGTAAFEGSALYSRSTENPSEILQNPDLQSSVALQADFNAMKLVGTFDRFRTMSGSLVAGTLSTDSVISGTKVSGLLSGNLTQSGTSRNFHGQLDGSFRGRIGDHFVGDLQISAGGEDLYGLFAARSQP